MFAKAYELASEFTRPVIISLRFFNNTVKCGCGAFVILNDEGWIATAAHVWDSYIAFRKHAKEISNYNTQVQAIQQDSTLNQKQKNKRISRLKTNPEWITNHSFWWANDGVSIKDIKALREADFLVGRLDPFDPKSVSGYPTLKNTSSLRLGTSLCKLGYPFHNIQATFDESASMFRLAPDALPLPRFPLEGIFTRHVMAGKSKNGKYEIKFIETSSPGLRGQSGGPIFDVRGTVWSIQSRTIHLPLGFSPKVKKDGKEVEENQFLNVGLGVHPEFMISFLRDNNIKFTLSNR